MATDIYTEHSLTHVANNVSSVMRMANIIENQKLKKLKKI